MPNLFFTGDTHFNHYNIIKYCRRPFQNTKEMDECVISRWNEVVGKADTIYHVGDFANKNTKYAEEILRRLNGRKFLCIGNHDKQMRQLARYFDDMRESFLIKTANKQLIFLSHYLHKVWPHSHYGAWHLFGHSHGGMNAYAEKEGKLLDVGVDSHDFYPWSLDEVARVMETRSLNFNDLKRRRNK